MKERRVSRRRDGSTQQSFHLPNGLVEAHQNRSGNDTVADIVFDDFRNVSQPRQVAIVQAVPGIDAHSEFARELRGLRNGLYLRVGLFRVPGIRIPASMELDEIS
jgi:hypothetical protein